MLFLASVKYTELGLYSRSAAVLSSWWQYLSEPRGEKLKKEKQFARSKPSSLAIEPKTI